MSTITDNENIHIYEVRYIFCAQCDREVELEDAQKDDGDLLCRRCHRQATGRSAWDDGKIRGDRRIDDTDPDVRRVAQLLHSNESMHMHEWIEADVCAYCALRASRAVRALRPQPEPTSEDHT